jgi:hypothetical protein
MVSNSLGKRRRRQRVCVMDLSYSHISLSAQSNGRTTTRERSDRRCTTFNILLPCKKITKTLPSKQAYIGTLGLNAKIPSDLIVSLLSGTDDNKRASHRNSKSRSRSTQIKTSQYSQSCLELLSRPQHKAQMRDYSRSRLILVSRLYSVPLFAYSAENVNTINIVPTMNSILFILNEHHFIIFVCGIK